MAVYVRPVLEWQASKGIQITEREIVIVQRAEGYAGRVDVIGQGANGTPFVLDYKTRKTKPGEPCTPYDGQATQIAAYAYAYWGPDAFARCYGANVYISTTEPGRMEVSIYTPEQLAREFMVFRCMCMIWRHLKGYDPRVASTQEGGAR
jgi:hypothetical protein